MVPSGRVKSISTSPAASALPTSEPTFTPPRLRPTAGLPRASSAAASCSDLSASTASISVWPILPPAPATTTLSFFMSSLPRVPTFSQSDFLQHAAEETALFGGLALLGFFLVGLPFLGLLFFRLLFRFGRGGTPILGGRRRIGVAGRRGLGRCGRRLVGFRRRLGGLGGRLRGRLDLRIESAHRRCRTFGGHQVADN